MAVRVRVSNTQRHPYGTQRARPGRKSANKQCVNANISKVCHGKWHMNVTLARVVQARSMSAEAGSMQATMSPRCTERKWPTPGTGQCAGKTRAAAMSWLRSLRSVGASSPRRRDPSELLEMVLTTAHWNEARVTTDTVLVVFQVRLCFGDGLVDAALADGPAQPCHVSAGPLHGKCEQPRPRVNQGRARLVTVHESDAPLVTMARDQQTVVKHVPQKGHGHTCLRADARGTPW